MTLTRYKGTVAAIRPHAACVWRFVQSKDDPFRSLIVSRVPQLVLFIAIHLPFARSYTLAKQEDD